MKAFKKKKFIASCKQQLLDLVEARELSRLYNIPFTMHIAGRAIRIY